MSVSKRGFASMTIEKRKEIASKGGRRAHELGRAHKWTSSTAQAAGKKGGAPKHKKNKRNPRTREAAKEKRLSYLEKLEGGENEKTE